MRLFIKKIARYAPSPLKKIVRYAFSNYSLLIKVKKPEPVIVDRDTNLRMLELSELVSLVGSAQALPVPEMHVEVHRHKLSLLPENATECAFYLDHEFRAPELRIERLVDHYWFPESGFLISKKGLAWRHSILGQYADPHFLTTYAVEERSNQDGTKAYSFYEHLLHEAPVLEGPHIITSHYASHNFGHFMMDMVPLIQLAETYNLKPLSRPLLEWQKPIYSLAGVDPSDVKEFSNRAVFLKEVFVSNRHNAVSTYAASPNHRIVFEKILNKIRIFPVLEPSRKLIFISRGISKSREINNRDVLEAALRNEGFTTIRPEKLTFTEQALLFSEADMVVSEFGAVMANVVFCKPRTKIIEIIPENQNDPWSVHLCASMNLEHVLLFHKVDDADREPIEIGGRVHTNIFFKYTANVELIIKTIRELNA